MSKRICAAKCVELRGGRGIIHAMFETHTVEGSRSEGSRPMPSAHSHRTSTTGLCSCTMAGPPLRPADDASAHLGASDQSSRNCLKCKRLAGRRDAGAAGSRARTPGTMIYWTCRSTAHHLRHLPHCFAPPLQPHSTRWASLGLVVRGGMANPRRLRAGDTSGRQCRCERRP